MADLNEFLWFKPGLPISRQGIRWRGPSADRVIHYSEFAPELPRSDLRELVVLRDLKMEAYLPLEEHPSLFRKFSDIEPTEDGFLRFVASYGFLAEPLSLKRLRRYRRADFFGNLFLAHHELKTAIQKFDSIRDEPPSSVSSGTLRVTVNKQLAGWGFDRDGAVSARVVWHLDRERRSESQELRIVPQSLLAAMWLQLAEEMTGNYRFRRCEGCNDWFKAGDSRSQYSRRSDAILCGDASCKMRAIRKRKRAEEARRQHRKLTSNGRTR